MTQFKVQLGTSGIEVPRLMVGAETLGGHGWGNVDIADVERACLFAIERGLNFFDVADCYGLGLAEERLGQLVRHQREKVVIASKFGVRIDNGHTWYDNSPKYMAQAVDASLRRLDTDYIDLYQLHWPDGKTPLSAVLEALERLREIGKIRAYGVSNVNLSETSSTELSNRLASFSLEYSLANRTHEDEVRKTCNRSSISFLSWGTLGQGVLSGKYSAKTKFSDNDRRSKPHWRNFQNSNLEKNLQIVNEMRSVAEDLAGNSMPLTAIAIAWNLAVHDQCIAIAGAKSIDQLEQNARALDIKLPEWAVERLDKVSSPIGNLQRTG